jgi:hypothetical protein
MERRYELFLQALRCALGDREAPWGAEVDAETVLQVLDLAQEHHVLPLIFQAVYKCPGAVELAPEIYSECKQATIQTVMTQTIKTEEFLELYNHLLEQGVKPLVVKGIVCRSLYPQPDYRYSGDEDVFCGEAQFPACHSAMIQFGMEPGGPGLEPYEVPYRKAGSPLYIELHKTLFARDHDVFSECNALFADAFRRAVALEIHGQSVYTLCPTDHMLYLIVHALKHFLHSGFGIRQVCDMVLFANHYDSQIDWAYILEKCRELQAEFFAAALLQIGTKYLADPAADAAWLEAWAHIEVDETDLLADLLYGGIYGSSDRSRVHSSNMTLNAAAADKRGKKARGNVLRTIFPSARSISGRFPYLRRHPYLLPVAWTCRIFGYARESITDPNSAAAEVIRTGEHRIELLRQYHIID